MDKLKEECGVFGIYDQDGMNLSNLTYFGLVALQHRGQESAGIAIRSGNAINYHKGMGLVQEVFDAHKLLGLDGDIAIGHVRYSTTGQSHLNNAQPLVVRFRGGSIALAHNGNLVNAFEIRNELEKNGTIFQTSIDSEVIANLIAIEYKGNIKEAVLSAVKQIKGAYGLVIIFNDKLIGVRDPNGLRPLVLGKTKTGYVLASETAALDVVGAEFVRDVQKGEMITIDENGWESIIYDDTKRKAICSFEYVYFARPDSIMDGQNIYKTRYKAGKILAKEHPVEADIVVAVPDSGIPAAIGYSNESGIPYDVGLIKNKYMGRTFIQPDQETRELAVKLKLNVLKENIDGKRLVLIDDSIVRGTTSRRIINMLREAGAKEVHVRVSSPPVSHSCYFGIDTPSKKHLVGAVKSVEEIRELIGADSLGYLSYDGLVDSIGKGVDKLCTACFNGDYPMPVPMSGKKYVFEKM
ncbi:MAG: amidophosphoribosyltransferase [Clostridiales bacterium]|nr:amidophosphoribosyltransferase [Clostridiales bacterium]